MKALLSSMQLKDASGEMGAVLRAESGVAITNEILRTPTYTTIQTHLQGSEGGSSLKNPQRQALLPIAGARAIAGYVVSGETTPYYAPSIVLSDGRIGLLHTAADAVRSMKETARFTDFQQLLLAGVYARQQEGVGSLHTRGIAEIGHATLIAVSREPHSIHSTTHSYADSKQFATKISAQTTIYNGHASRPTNTFVLEPTKVTMLVFLPDNQAPLPASAFEASAGFALAATKTQPKPLDVRANAGAMAAQMGV